jgi:acyl-[acyl-carrier-protein]-phospholipid O-acyltransferase / long-chain-fatty-acid--[acyl-carrier-protein] ligase
VSVDAQRFITILGRAKRFAKIAGEMVSLTMLETKLQIEFPEQLHAVVSIADKKKGEQLVLFTTLEKADRKKISDGLKVQGVADLMIPRNVFQLEALPLLGSGKIDYVALLRMAKEKVPE